MVAFDERGVPVSELVIDRDAIKFSPNAGNIEYFSPARRTALRSLLSEIGALPPSDAELETLERRQSDIDGELHAVRFLPNASGVDVRRRSGDLDARERSQLCAWREQVFRNGPVHPDGGVQCRDGAAFVGLDYAHCQSSFPTCGNLDVAQLEACVRRQRFDVCFEQPGAATCRTLRACLPGTRPAAAR